MAQAQITNSLGVVDTVSGIEIHATSTGKFAAIVDGILVELASKGAVTKRVQGLQRPIKCMDVGSSGYPPKVRDVTRVTKAKQVAYREEKSWTKGEYVELTDSQYGWYFYDEAACNELREIYEKLRALHQRRDELTRTLRPVNSATWGEEQMAVQATAAESEG